MAQNDNAGMLALAALAAFVFWPRNASASIAPGEAYPGILPGDTPPVDYDVPPADLVPWQYDAPAQIDLYPIPDISTEPVMSNLDAFLMMIRKSENAAQDVADGIDYQTFYGGSRFYDLSDHPAITGEKVGVKLPDAWCIAAGYGPGCVSTAAGAYQITRTTWKRIRAASGWGPYLNDFSPASQDAAAVRLLREANVLTMIDNGQIEQAIYKVAGIWASLPRSKSKQPQRSLPEVLAFYNDSLTGA